MLRSLFILASRHLCCGKAEKRCDRAEADHRAGWSRERRQKKTTPHSVKGNVDILIALVMHTGAVIGAQIGAVATQYFAGPKIRLAFVPLPLIGAAIVIYTLMTGHKL